MSENQEKRSPGPAGVLAEIRMILRSFEGAGTFQKVVVVGMLGGIVICLASLAWQPPAWAAVLIAVCGLALLVLCVLVLRVAEKPTRCLDVPIYPLQDQAKAKARDLMDEIRSIVANRLHQTHPEVTKDQVRANMFLLARMRGGRSDGACRLVIDRDLTINMSNAPELDLQFRVGQGATGVAFRDGEYQLTRRLSGAGEGGQWEQRYRMTPALSARVHENLSWILTFPLKRPITDGDAKGQVVESVGILNVDGLVDVPDDQLLNSVAGNVLTQVDILADLLSVQPSTCMAPGEVGAFGS